MCHHRGIYTTYMCTTTQPDTQRKQYTIRAAHTGSNIHWLTCVEAHTQREAISNFVVTCGAHWGCNSECACSRVCGLWHIPVVHTRILSGLPGNPPKHYSYPFRLRLRVYEKYSCVFPVNRSNPGSKYYTTHITGHLW